MSKTSVFHITIWVILLLLLTLSRSDEFTFRTELTQANQAIDSLRQDTARLAEENREIFAENQRLVTLVIDDTLGHGNDVEPPWVRSTISHREAIRQISKLSLELQRCETRLDLCEHGTGLSWPSP